MRRYGPSSGTKEDVASLLARERPRGTGDRGCTHLGEAGALLTLEHCDVARRIERREAPSVTFDDGGERLVIGSQDSAAPVSASVRAVFGPWRC